MWTQNLAAAPDDHQRVRAVRFTAADGAWSPAEQIDDPDASDVGARDPDLAVDGAGNAVVFWQYSWTGEIGSARYVAP